MFESRSSRELGFRRIEAEAKRTALPAETFRASAVSRPLERRHIL